MHKNPLLKTPIFVDADMSQASLTSTIISVRYQDNICLQLNFTGTPTGTFDVQGSVDYNISDPTDAVIVTGNWISVPLTPSPVAAGAGDSILFDLNQQSYPFIRVVYTKTSGTGVLNGFVFGKQV